MIQWNGPLTSPSFHEKEFKSQFALILIRTLLSGLCIIWYFFATLSFSAVPCLFMSCVSVCNIIFNACRVPRRVFHSLFLQSSFPSFWLYCFALPSPVHFCFFCCLRKPRFVLFLSLHPYYGIFILIYLFLYQDQLLLFFDLFIAWCVLASGFKLAL